MNRYSAATLAALVFGVAGCAVKPIDRNGARMKSQDGIVAVSECTKTFDTNYCDAITLADGYRRGYLRRASGISALRETTGLIAIPAAAAALYYGLSGREVFNDRILRLSTGAAGLYAAGQWSLKPAREQAYLAGAQAMTCAVIKSMDNVVPRAVAGKDILAVLTALSDDTVALQTTVDGGRLSPLVRDQATAQLNAANEVYGNLSYLHGETLRAGTLLSARVLMIDAQVRELVSRNTPTLDSLNALLGGLQGYAKTFGSDRVIAPPQTTKSGFASSKDRKRLRLDTSQDSVALKQIDKLGRTIADARIYLRYADSAKTSFEAVAACAPEGAKSFTISPDTGSVDIAATQSYSLTITDRVGRPVVSLGGTPNAKVTLQPVQFGKSDDQYVVVVATAATEEQITGAVLSIRSANGLEGRDIAITVAPAAPKALPDPDPPRTKPAGEARYADEQLFLDSKADVFAVQCLVAADPDCRMGPDTRAAIANFRARHGLSGADQIDQPLLDKAKAEPFFNDLFTCDTLAATRDERTKACRKAGGAP